MTGSLAVRSFFCWRTRRRASLISPRDSSPSKAEGLDGSAIRKKTIVTQRANGGKLIQTYTPDQGAGHMIISTQITGRAP